MVVNGADSGQPGGHTPPSPSTLRAFWDVYEPVRDEVSDALTASMREYPELGALLARQDEAQQAAVRQRSHELLERAVAGGDWTDYRALLREQGRQYARLGMSFDAWMTATRGFHSLLSERIVNAYHDRPEVLAEAFGGLQEFTDYALGVIGQTYIEAKEEVILRQHEAIAELATPVLPVAEGLLVLPIIGVIDSARAAQLTEHLLNAIRSYRARVAVVDITGVPAVDSAVANHLLQTVQAVRLMGARAIVSGLSAVNAQILVRIGVDLSMLHTVSDLQAAIDEANTLLGRHVVPVVPVDAVRAAR